MERRYAFIFGRSIEEWIGSVRMAGRQFFLRVSVVARRDVSNNTFLVERVCDAIDGMMVTVSHDDGR